MFKVWYIYGRIVHGYEMEGIEKIPDSGPAILILYHAETPTEAGFFHSEIYLKKNRKIIQIVDRAAKKIPGYLTFMEAAEQTEGSLESCVEMMRRGELLAIYPGGTREALLADVSQYQVLWSKTAGFAKIAVQAKVVSIFEMYFFIFF